MKKIYLLALVVFGFSVNSFAQVNAPATASATIIAPIAIVKATDMNFGNLAVGTTAGEIVLSPAGARTPGGGVTLPASGGTVSAASFNVTGESGTTYSITLPSTISLSNGLGESMDLEDFTSASGTAANSASTGILTGGAQTIFVGATLNVAASQAKGSYTTTTPFEVTVNYN